MWDRNFFLDEEEIDRDAVREILWPSGKNELERRDYFTKCKNAFGIEVLGLDSEEVGQPPKALHSNLNGAFWK